MGSVRGSGTSGYIQTNKFILPNTYYRYVKDIRIRNRSVTNKKNANERKEDDDENSSKGTKQRIEDIVRQLNDKDKTKRIRKNEIKKVLNLGVEYCNKTLTGATFSSVTIAINKSLTRLEAVMFGEKDSRVSGNRVLQSVRDNSKTAAKLLLKQKILKKSQKLRVQIENKIFKRILNECEKTNYYKIHS